MITEIESYGNSHIKAVNVRPFDKALCVCGNLALGAKQFFRGPNDYFPTAFRHHSLAIPAFQDARGGEEAYVRKRSQILVLDIDLDARRNRVTSTRA